MILWMYSAVLVIAGTTAVGKTDLSLELSKILNGEIISADSVQVGTTVRIVSEPDPSPQLSLSRSSY